MKEKMKNQCAAVVTAKVGNYNINNFLSCLSPTNWFNFPPIINTLRLEGVIKSGKDGLNIENMNPLIEKAFKGKRTIAVCLLINSPGGSPVQSELIANRIIELSKQKNIPVYSFVEDVAASGGYWLACSGKEIYASKSSILGSIGVISRGFGFHEVIKKIGIDRRIYSQGKNKSILDPFEAPKAHDVKIITKLQSFIHTNFINYVKSRRAGKLTQSEAILFNGEFWAGEQSLDFGLIDGIDDFYHFIYKKFGDKVKINYLKSKNSLLRKLISMSTNEAFSQILHKSEEQLSQKKYDLF